VDEATRLMIENYRIQGMILALRGDREDLEKHLREAFREGRWEIEGLRRHVQEAREILAKRIEALDNPVIRFPWPNVGTRVWVPFRNAPKVEPCPACEGTPLIVKGGATFQCMECRGTGTRTLPQVVPVEVTMVKATYLQGGGCEGWGKVGEVYIDHCTLWYVDEQDKKWISQGEFKMHRSREECQRDIDHQLEKGYSQDHWPRFKRQ
jgi:hypothetical protein